MIRTALIPAIACLVASPGPPPPGFTTDCYITEVYDGDTVTVTFEATAHVRLRNCWAPEIRTKDDAEKTRGIASRDHLARVCGMQWDAKAKRWRGKTPARLVVPFGQTTDIGELTTMGRVLGDVWVDGATISERQVTASHATPARAE